MAIITRQMSDTERTCTWGSYRYAHVHVHAEYIHVHHTLTHMHALVHTTKLWFTGNSLGADVV